MSSGVEPCCGSGLTRDLPSRWSEACSGAGRCLWTRAPGGPEAGRRYSCPRQVPRLPRQDGRGRGTRAYGCGGHVGVGWGLWAESGVAGGHLRVPSRCSSRGPRLRKPRPLRPRLRLMSSCKMREVRPMRPVWLRGVGWAMFGLTRTHL